MPATRRPRSFAVSNGGYRVKRKRVAYRPAAGQMVIVAGPQRAFQNQELKFFDTELTSTVMSATWAALEPATTNLSAVAQGDGESNRDGRKYTIKSVHIKGFFETTAQESQTTPPSDILVRVVLVHDTQTNGAQLTATEVMDAGGTDDINSFRNLGFTKRFRVLDDQTMRLVRLNTNEGAVNLFASAATQTPFTMNKVFKTPMNVLMSDTGADIANVTDNSLHMIAITTSTAALINYQCRVRFTG